MVGRASEEWEEWREWRDDFAGKKRERTSNRKLGRLKPDALYVSAGEDKHVGEHVKIVGLDRGEDVQDIAA